MTHTSQTIRGLKLALQLATLLALFGVMAMTVPHNLTRIDATVASVSQASDAVRS